MTSRVIDQTQPVQEKMSDFLAEVIRRINLISSGAIQDTSGRDNMDELMNTVNNLVEYARNLDIEDELVHGVVGFVTHIYENIGAVEHPELQLAYESASRLQTQIFEKGVEIGYLEGTSGKTAEQATEARVQTFYFNWAEYVPEGDAEAFEREIRNLATGKEIDSR